MLVSFALRNYFSFADEQTLTMETGSSQAVKNENYSFRTHNTTAPHLLRSACVFGPNGAGKSTLVSALSFYKNFILGSAIMTQQGDPISVTPFLLDEKWSKKPSSFEACFIHERQYYQYGFAVDKDRVWEEWLFIRSDKPKAKKRKLFERRYDPQKDSYDWEIHKVDKQVSLWKESTRDNALFVSTATQLNSKIFSSLFSWVRKLRIISAKPLLPLTYMPSYSSRKYASDKELKPQLLKLLQGLDFRITDFSVNPEERKVQFHHRHLNGKTIPFDFDDESDGHKVFFGLAGPLIDAFKNGRILVIDEVHNCMHPLALKYLVSLFHDPENNKNNAQLLYTSHETSIIKDDFMHLDQVWFINKDKQEKTQEYPLSDYNIRDLTSFQKFYLGGRFGAVPIQKPFVLDENMQD